MSGNSRSTTRALTPEELKERGYIPDIPVDVEVKEPTGSVAPIPDLMSEPVGDQYTTSPTPLPEEVNTAPIQTQPQVPTKNWQPEIDAARKQGDDLRFGANIARVGEDINRAFVPRQGSGHSFAKDIEEQAKIPEQRVREDMATSATQAKALAPKTDEDPFSLGNISFRNALAATPQFAGFVKALKDKGAYDNLTEAKFKTLLNAQQSQTKLNEGIENNDGKLRISENKLTQDQTQDEIRNNQMERRLDEMERHNQAAENIGITNATRMTESYGVNSDTGRSPVDDRKFAGNLQALSKATLPYAEITQALKNIDGYLPGITDGKLPKDYPISTADKAKALLLGGALAGTIKQKEEAIIKAQQDFAKIVSAYRSGLTVSEQERAYYDQMFGNKVWASPVQFVNAVNLFKKYVYGKLSTAQQGFEKTGNPTIDKFQPLEDWENIEGSISYRDPYWKSVGGPGNRGAPKPAPVQNQSPQVSTPVSTPPPPPPPPPPPTQAPTQTPDRPKKFAPDGEELVPVTTPDGKNVNVRKSQLEKALKDGYKLR